MEHNVGRGWVAGHPTLRPDKEVLSSSGYFDGKGLWMVQQVLIADADRSLSDLYCDYFSGRGYKVRVVSSGVDCAQALRESPPSVLVLDTELKWGGADGILALMEQDKRLSAVPVVLLNDVDADPAADSTESSVPAELGHSPQRRANEMTYPATAHLAGSPSKRVMERLRKPFQFRHLLECIGAAAARCR